MNSPFTTGNQKSKICSKWELCEELNLLWKHCQQLELPMSSPSCVTDTWRNLCSNEQLRSDVHSCPRALIHCGMVIQPISVIYISFHDAMFYFSSCPWETLTTLDQLKGHTHTSAKPAQHHFPSKSLCFLGNLPMMWVLLSLSPCSRATLAWHEREVTFLSIRESKWSLSSSCYSWRIPLSYLPFVL